jgi:hypothetical protein
VRQTLDTVDAFLLELDGEILIVLAEERRGALGEHALDGFRIVALVRGHELDGVAGRDLHEGWLEHHHTIRSLVEELDFDLRRPGAPGQNQNRRGGGQHRNLFHDSRFFPVSWNLRPGFTGLSGIRYRRLVLRRLRQRNLRADLWAKRLS